MDSTVFRRAIATAAAIAAAVTQVPARAAPLQTVRLVSMGTFDLPVSTAVRPGEPSSLYIVEKRGTVRALRGGVFDPAFVIDLRGELSQDGDRGLLGVAFSPDGTWMYTFSTDLDGASRLSAFRMSGTVADPATRRDLLVVPHPSNNHYGGTIAFGRDGSLYVSIGDGGCCGDPWGNAQKLSTLLGKILRIDPRPEADPPYAIPPSNPFLNVPDARAEIWAFGLRNPWRWSFDQLTGDLWIGDVGQDAWEEIDFQPSFSSGGENYGWKLMEGNHSYAGGSPPQGHVPPVYEYPHSVGCSVTGGVVGRSQRNPVLFGAYVFTDFCNGRLQVLRRIGALHLYEDLELSVPLPTALGQDAAGDVYVLSLFGGVYRIDRA